ncbi:hypothetical protein DF186_25505, partial [Enterococcus hirae]
MQKIKLQKLKNKTPIELLTFAKTLEIKNTNAIRKQKLIFTIL